MAVDPRDIRSMQVSGQLPGRIALWILRLTSLLLVVAGAFNIATSLRWAKVAEMSPADLLREWSMPLEPLGLYDGAFILASQKLEAGLLEVVLGLGLGVLVLIIQGMRARDQRLLAAMKDAGMLDPKGEPSGVWRISPPKDGEPS